MAHLLLVEDDVEIGQLLHGALRANGHEVSWQRTGHSALLEADRTTFELVLLDLGLPDVDGVEVCRDLRVRQPGCVLVMLTARRDEMDVVVGLEAGADDYLTKPFGLTEVLARVRAHLRRRTFDSMLGEEGTAMAIGDLTVDIGSRRASIAGVDFTLRTKEFDLLARLAREPGRAISRETLMSDVWDENWFGSTRTLDVHIASLRRRLADAAETHLPVQMPIITTLRGHGYRLDPAPPKPGSTDDHGVGSGS